MPKITFMPINRTFEGQVGESILDVAINNDVPLQHACGGFCACSTCHIHILEGEAGLTEMEDEEDERLGGVERLTPKSRLSCQAKLKGGDLVVEIQNLDN